MTKFALIFSLILIPEVVLSQTAVQSVSGATAPTAEVLKIVRVRYGNAHTLAGLARMNGVNIDADDAMQVIVVKGDRAQVAAMEQTIHELDVPPTVRPPAKDVEVTVSVIGGSSNVEGGPGVQMSEDMTPVVKQLRAIFPYKNYQVFGSMLLRSREGANANSRGVMRSVSSFGSYSFPTVYTVHYEDGKASGAEGKGIIHLSNFLFTMHVPLQNGGTGPPPQMEKFDVSIGTDLDLREGQKVVVGKANVENSDSAMFVVLTARLVE